MILFDEYFKVSEAYKIPYRVVHNIASKKGKWSKQQNGYIIHATNELILNPSTIDLTSMFK